MSAEEKVGQLFFALASSTDEEALKTLVEKYHVGGCRYNSAPGLTVRRQIELLQQYSKLPLFIAANTEEGGDACADGTFLGSGVKIGATGKPEYAYKLGRLANQEAAAVGCNMAFAPVCDISYNWRNTEIISRAFGRDPKQVAQMSVEYLRGAHTIPGFVCAAKHFPGNGRDFRDAHLANHVNDLSPREWNDTYRQSGGGSQTPLESRRRFSRIFLAPGRCAAADFLRSKGFRDASLTSKPDGCRFLESARLNACLGDMPCLQGLNEPANAGVS